MAKTTEQTDTPNFNIEMYKPDTDGKPYLAHVQALVAADANRTQEQIDAGEHASIKVTFPKEENGKPAVDRYKRYFRESAAPELSAKVISETDQGDSVEVRYIVVPKIVRPRKPKAVEQETEQEEAAAA